MFENSKSVPNRFPSWIPNRFPVETPNKFPTWISNKFRINLQLIRVLFEYTLIDLLFHAILEIQDRGEALLHRALIAQTVYHWFAFPKKIL